MKTENEQLMQLLRETAALNKKTAADLEAIIERQNDILIADIQPIIERQAELYREFETFLREVKQ